MKNQVHREPLTSDIIFKAVYGQDNPECKRALILLLNLILEREDDPIIDLIYKNPFSIAECTECNEKKPIVMDILVETKNGEQIDIEMQVHVSSIFISRTLFYGCDLIRQGLELGSEYDKLKKSIVISIVRGRLFPEQKEAHTCFTLRERNSGRELTDLLQLHYLELGKLNWKGKPPEMLSPLEQLGAYFCCSGQPEQAAYLESLLRTESEVISVTDELLKKVSEDERLWAFRRSREMFERDQISLRNQAWRDGRKEGLEKGMAEGKREESLAIAKRMKVRGFEMEEIVEMTGLSPDDITDL